MRLPKRISLFESNDKLSEPIILEIRIWYNGVRDYPLDVGVRKDIGVPTNHQKKISDIIYSQLKEKLGELRELPNNRKPFYKYFENFGFEMVSLSHILIGTKNFNSDKEFEDFANKIVFDDSHDIIVNGNTQ